MGGGAGRRVPRRAVPGHGRRGGLGADLRPREHADPLVRILVCVKRVPLTGGRIVLTEDAQAIETKHLGFTISPHEECGVEEAVRLIEATRRRVGRPDAWANRGRGAAPRRDGARRRPRDPPRHGRRGVGPAGDSRRHRRCDPRGRGGARPLRSRLLRERVGGRRQLSRWESGSRTRSAVPSRPDSRASRVEGGTVRCEQEFAGGRDVYVLPLPAVVTVLEGLNLPRYPSVPSKLRAQRKPLRSRRPDRRRGSR